MKIHHTYIPKKLTVLSLAVCLLSPLAPVSSALAAPPSTVRVSVASTGTEGDYDSGDSSISANGRFVVFVSYASNLVAEDNNGHLADVYVRDLKTGVTQRVSVDSAGAEGNSDSESPAISADGRFVVFYSFASNLVAGDNNGVSDVFLRDLKTGVTQRVSLDSAGAEGNFNSFSSSISADGRFVAFSSNATNLVAGDNNGVRDIFLRDLKTGVTQRVSVDSAGAEGNSDSYTASISANGRFVVFDSYSTNLVVGDNNGVSDIFLRDLKTGVTQRVSVDSAGAEGNSNSYESAISANGRFVAFSSPATNLVAGDNNGVEDVYVRDLKTGVTQRVSVDSAGAEGNSGSYGPAISADGRFVAFSSNATNLVAGDTSVVKDIFVRDLKTGVTQRVSVDSAGAEGNSGSYGPAISANGRFVAFTSGASNLVAGDNNGVEDVYVRRRW